jgi:hypothetical protein
LVVGYQDSPSTMLRCARGAKIVKMGLDFQGQRADMYCNFSQLRLGDSKGLPYFFAHSDCRWAIPHQFSIPFASS